MANPEHIRRARQYSKRRFEGLRKWREEMASSPRLRSPASFFPDSIDLTGADLRGADLSGVTLYRARLHNANLAGAVLQHCDLSRSDLSGASLVEADLAHANFTDAELTGADLHGAVLFYTVLANVNLANVAGLHSVHIDGPLIMTIDTLYRSQGGVPEAFLRNAGVPEEIIDILPLIRNRPAIPCHSCFISYSTKDGDFARRLHSRMREANMRVWFAPEDLAGGKKLHEQLFSAIQVNDKLLLVLSPHSIQSEWVMTEMRKAREVEKKENRRKLFPIRLVDFDTLRSWSCFDAESGKDLAVEVREYFIPDFSNWKDHDAFEAAFARLQKDLKAENSGPA